MKKSRRKCDPILLNKFFDKELRPDERAQMTEHLRDCPSCQKALQENESLSALFTDSLDKSVSQAIPDDFEYRIISKLETRNSKLESLIPILNSQFSILNSLKKFFIPAMATAILILFFSFTKPPASVAGPSAIVSSFTGDIASVMILETPESHQTIIWFNETF
ncbi:anti-sigma factor family protein [Desulfonema magnum]|uniref:Zinc finger-containing protein n=1 Tax=Desulfonema magnum TaxID=45655 RepID=A0A975BXQ0_9BACT|nr:zf-HC2 domain-containing protein [Desulfonema magnum]QTA93709.1 Putative zinc finger-containing protein [Desulfonema magnum]